MQMSSTLSFDFVLAVKIHKECINITTSGQTNTNYQILGENDS